MPSARVVFQCCTSAKLPISTDNESIVSINKGLIAYIAFLEDCSQSTLQKLSEAICSVRLINSDDGKLSSVSELPCDLLLVPQFCLSGKLKGKVFQYHKAVKKDLAEDLFNGLVTCCKTFLANSLIWNASDSVVKNGTFGIRQCLSIETNGKKVRVKCNPEDKVGDLKKLIAAQTGTKSERIILKKWYTVYKDNITLRDYEINDGMNLELYYQ